MRTWSNFAGWAWTLITGLKNVRRALIPRKLAIASRVTFVIPSIFEIIGSSLLVHLLALPPHHDHGIGGIGLRCICLTDSMARRRDFFYSLKDTSPHIGDFMITGALWAFARPSSALFSLSPRHWRHG